MNPHDLGWNLVIELARRRTPLPYILIAAQDASKRSPEPEKFYHGAQEAADLVTSLSWTSTQAEPLQC